MVGDDLRVVAANRQVCPTISEITFGNLYSRASAGQKKSRPMAGFSLQSTCREFRESDRTNKFYRPRSPPRPRILIFRTRVVARASRVSKQVRPIPVDRRCSSLQPKPVATHLLTFPLSPLRPRQARRTVLLWLRLRRLVRVP